MSGQDRQPRLLAFSGGAGLRLEEDFKDQARQHLLGMRQLLGDSLIAISTASSPAELLFFRACVDLRLPVIVLEPPQQQQQMATVANQALSRALRGVALARYPIPAGNNRPISSYLLEWADALLLAAAPDSAPEFLNDAMALGIPALAFGAGISPAWRVPFHDKSSSRHGFGSRRELLDFLDLRFGGPEGA